MKKTLLTLLTLLFCTTGQLFAADRETCITLLFPEAILNKTMQQVLPLSFKSTNAKMEGTITISEISDIRITGGRVSCHLNLAGQNLSLIASLNGQAIKLKIGDAHVDFNCVSQIRYDAQRKSLFIMPTANDIDTSQALQSGDISKSMLTFFNGHEFEIKLQDIAPLITEVSGKIITLQSDIQAINPINGAFEILLTPRVTVSQKRQI